MIIIKQIFLKQRANSNYYFMDKSEHDFLENEAVRFFHFTLSDSLFHNRNISCLTIDFNSLTVETINFFIKII